MHSTLFKCAAIIALMSSSSAPAQSAAQPCLTRAEMDGMVSYALPTVIKTVATTCGPTLPENAILTTRSKSLLAELEPRRAAALPLAKIAFNKIGGGGDQKMARVFDALPDEAFGPIIDAVVAEELGSSIRPESCGDISRIFETLAPLPATNFVDLVTEVLVVASRKDKRMRSCPGN